MSDDRMTKADFVYNADDWETTYDAIDQANLTGDLDPGVILTMGRMKALPPKYVVMAPIEWDEYGEATDWEELEFWTHIEAAEARDRKAPQ
jgi:hypothetical protein